MLKSHVSVRYSRGGDIGNLVAPAVVIARVRHRIKPFAERSDGDFRLYDEAAVERLLFIKHCRSLDLSLPEIRQLLGLSRSPYGVRNSHYDTLGEALLWTLAAGSGRGLHNGYPEQAWVEVCGLLAATMRAVVTEVESS